MRHIPSLVIGSIATVLVLCAPALAQQGACPPRKLANGQWANPNWCKPQAKPQILPAPPAASGGGQIPAGQSNVIYQQGGPQPAYYVSPRCYVTTNPPNGCSIQYSAVPGTGCYCLDAYGNAYNGTIY
jgi:hypothetical protein